VYPKNSSHGTTLAEVLLSLAISSIIMYAILLLLTGTFFHKQFYYDVFNELQKSSRIISTIESRIVNAGLGIPGGENVEDIFRFPTGTSVLSGWKDALEILTSKDISVNLQNIGGELVARGERMRVLSTLNAASEIRIVPASAEWGPHETRTVNIRKHQNKYVSYSIVSNKLSSWIMMPSFGRPVIIRNFIAPPASNSGSIQLQNPLSVSMDWHGIDMFHSFRISYFYVLNETLCISDSDKSDNELQNQPVVDDVLSACFELNKTARTLKCWFLIRSYSPTVKPGIPIEWPEWATVQQLNKPVSSNKLKVVSHSWRLPNI